MRLLLQKVTSASVSIEGEETRSIKQGYVLFLGILQGDTAAHAQLLAEKIGKLRLFEGANGTINHQSILDIHGEILVISQFTLAGSTKKGNRPDYTEAAPPDDALPLYNYFIQKLKELGIQNVQTGTFGAHMNVSLVNNGPVTLILER